MTLSLMNIMQEIDKRIRVDFPQKFGNNESRQTTRPVQSVASANRSAKHWSQTNETHIISSSNS